MSQRSIEAQRYDRVARQVSQLITARYSSSFALASRLFGKRLAGPIYAVYGFVRVADELVDTFDRDDRAQLLREYQQQTETALERGFSSDLVLHSYAQVASEYQFEPEWTAVFFTSMTMDLDKQSYSQEQYEEYIYGSAEVVGLMCLAVFCDGEKEWFRELAPSARSLGSAFQKVNFLRDLAADFEERGRLYFPGLKSIDKFTTDSKKSIEADIARDFANALPGLNALPWRARLGVGLAYRSYTQLLQRIQALTPEELLAGRASLGRGRKLWLLAITLIMQGLLRQPLN